MTKTQRKEMIFDVMSERIRLRAYSAWYISKLNTGKLTGTFLSERFKK